MLSVEILDMKLDGLGFTALWPGIGMFPDWVRRKEFGILTRVVEVKDGFVHWSDTREAAGPADDRRDRASRRCMARCSPSTTARMAATSTCRR